LAGSGAAALLGAATAGVGGLGDDAEGAAGAAAAAATGGGVFCGGDCATPAQPAVTSRQSSSALIARANCNRELTAILAETDMRDDFDLTARHTGGSTPEAFGVDVRSETTK